MATKISTNISEVAGVTAESFGDEHGNFDFTPKSLVLLDDAIEDIWGEDGPSEENFNGIVWAYGCYVADVVQRNYKGKWKKSENGGYDYFHEAGMVSFNPWSWVVKRFIDGDLIAPKYSQIAKFLK